MSILSRLSSLFFLFTKVPPSFKALLASDGLVIIAAQSGSPIIDGLLLRLAKKSGAAPIPYSAPGVRHRLRWTAISDLSELERLRQEEPNLSFSTLNIFSRRGPVKSSPSNRFSLLGLAALLLGSRFFYIAFGDPVALEASEIKTGKQLARRIKVNFYQNLKIVRGTPFQPLDIQAKLVLAGDEYQREVRILAQRQGVSQEKIHAEARAEFLRIAANPRSALYDLAANLCRFLLNRLFGKIEIRGLPALASNIKEHPVVLVPMHRSHLDYILLGSLLYHSNLMPPVVAAGINLSSWPFGYFIRSLGGYFVKRNARGERIHGLVLRRYVTYLLKRGHLQEFFIEGGRSRTGRMARPKFGILNILAQAFLKGIRKDVLFVPVSIAYENVIEARSFGDEGVGRKKSKENIFNLIRARGLFFKRYGDVIIDFGDAISLSKFATEKKALGEKIDDKAIVQTLGASITERIRSQTSITFSSLAAASLMSAPRYSLERRDLERSVRRLAAVVERVRQIGLISGVSSPSLKNFMAGKDRVLEDFARGGLVERQFGVGRELFFIPGSKRFTSDFYKNAAVHALLFPTILSVLERANGAIRIDEAKAIHRLLEYDFILPNFDRFSKELALLAEELTAMGELQLSDGGALKFGSHESSFYLPSTLLAHFQGLAWVMEHLTFSKYPEHGGTEGEIGPELNYEILIQSIQENFKLGAHLGILSRTESASRVAAVNHLETLANLSLIAIEEVGGKRTSVRITAPLDEDLLFVRRMCAAMGI